MKRSGPLKRKTPLKRGGRLRQVSEKKANWKRRYSVALAARKREQISLWDRTMCERCELPGSVDGHHPGGQNGARIMTFRLICRTCHDWIHFTNPNKAREEGWITD